MKIKFTLIDYIIIILVICAIVFAFIHITTDDSSDLQKTAFDESTANKIPDTYLKYYRDGYIVKSTVEGFNSSNGEKVTLNGTVIWQDDHNGNAVRLLIESGNETYLVGFYRTVPDADIYIDHISLESNGEKYKDLCEIKVKPEEVTSLKDITSKLPKNVDCEISTSLYLDSLNVKDVQKAINKIFSDSKRHSISADADTDDQIVINKATKQDLESADSIIGGINGVSDEITIRIYDVKDSQINEIGKNFDVINIQKF